MHFSWSPMWIKNRSKLVNLIFSQREYSISSFVNCFPNIYFETEFTKQLNSFQDKLRDHGCKLRYRQNRLRNSLYSRWELIRIHRNFDDCKEIQDNRLDLDDWKVFAILLTYKQPTGKFSSRQDQIVHLLLLALKWIFWSFWINFLKIKFGNQEVGKSWLQLDNADCSWNVFSRKF